VYRLAESIKRTLTAPLFADPVMQVGLPLTMIPNYETYECKFCFGATPEPPETDPAFATPCFQQCPTARALLNQQVPAASPTHTVSLNSLSLTVRRSIPHPHRLSQLSLSQCPSLHPPPTPSLSTLSLSLSVALTPSLDPSPRPHAPCVLSQQPELP
jgi:hypothetical protein